MPTSNLSVSLGYKGSGKPNAVAAYNDLGAYLLGGIPAADDTQTPYFGCLVSVNPSGSDDSQYYCGIPSGYVAVGIILYHAGIAMNDPAKPDSFLSTQPATIMNCGNMWLAHWGKTAPGSIDPRIGSVVIANNTSGLIEFMPQGSTAPTGWTVVGASVKSVSDDTSGVMLFVKI